MELIPCQEMKEADSRAINIIGIPSIVLMENAAIKVIKNINLKLNHYSLVCSRGNNGGDGLSVVRHLLLKMKKGLVKNGEYIGEVLIEDIGIPWEFIEFNDKKPFM